MLLRGALLDGNEALAAWRELEPVLDASSVDAGSSRLLPLVHANLQRLGVESEKLRPFAQVRRATWIRNQQTLAECEPLLRRLSAQFPIVILKGAALAERIYGDSSLRPFGDVDVLVPAGKFKAAYRIAREEGWRAADQVSGSYLRLRHAMNLAKIPRGAADIHARLLYLGARHTDESDIRRDAVPIGDNRYTLSDTVHLLQACIHGIPWSHVPSIRWLADSYLLITTGQIDWTKLVAFARRRDCTLGLYRALLCLQDVLDVDIPGATMRELAAMRPSWRERLQVFAVSRHWSLLGQFPAITAYYIRSLDPAAPRTWFDGPAHFRAFWGLRSLTEVGPAFADRAISRAKSRIVNGGGEEVERRHPFRRKQSPG